MYVIDMSTKKPKVVFDSWCTGDWCSTPTVEKVQINWQRHPKPHKKWRPHERACGMNGLTRSMANSMKNKLYPTVESGFPRCSATLIEMEKEKWMCILTKEYMINKLNKIESSQGLTCTTLSLCTSTADELHSNWTEQLHLLHSSSCCCRRLGLLLARRCRYNRDSSSGSGRRVCGGSGWRIRAPRCTPTGESYSTSNACRRGTWLAWIRFKDRWRSSALDYLRLLTCCSCALCCSTSW